ncbi:Pre-mRNA splicing factor PRP21 like protein-domain-containing protein [Diaporthe sp. PMI_573]|nr:Pre-mRNA splicing factor PRP21 like protein-domain-containing protein [Diaporthaceae sp. PMI_573]
MATTNGDAAAAAAAAAAELDQLKPPPGIVVPPPGEIREAIEKTAGFVARRGVSFEERIRESHGANPKFSFLNGQVDPYNAWYEWRKEQYKSGNVTAHAAGRVGEDFATPAKEEPKGPPKPPDFQFSARMPRINQKDLEILRLTALFVARNGRQFMTTLAQREGGNPQFQFLIQNHTFHNYFQHTIDQYSILLREGGGTGEGTKAQQERVGELQRTVDDKFHVLARARQRAEWAKYQEAERIRKEEEEEEEKLEFARIDWNDFVVVETIVFTESDDQANLPPPTSLNDLQYASLEEKNNIAISSNLRLEEAFPFDDHTFTPAAQQTLPVHPSPAAQATPPQFQSPMHPPSHAATTPAVRARSAQEEEEVQRIQEREQARARMQQAQADARGGPAQVKIREAPVPRAAARNANKVSAKMAICPNCKQQIPLNELQEHMRIELLDPRWKEQKSKADSRYATTNLSTVDVANNLKRLASQRSDVFDGVTGLPVSEEEAARRKKVAVNAFDGNPDGKSQAHMNHLQSVNVEEQIRAIHQKFATGEKR